MAVFSRDPREHWPKPHFSKNEVAKSGPYLRLLAECDTEARLEEWKKAMVSAVQI